MYLVVFTKQAAKDAKKLKTAGLDRKAKAIISVLETNPFATPPAYEAPVGNLAGFFSRRISIQHRLVYTVDAGKIAHNGTEYEGTVKVVQMWTHYKTVN
jgi:Txe/YoeB family toxin of toxin-antitoxin system